MRTSCSVLALLTAISLPFSGAFASDIDTKNDNQSKDDHHDHSLEEIIVSTDPLRKTLFQSLQATTVISGEALQRQLSATIGDTLDHLPGISQTSFGPGASRPIIRGLGGDRIRVLLNGIGSIDVSTTSPDHAVAADLSTAERVEIIKGPSTLIYGNNAAGGVISVFDGRIPSKIDPDSDTKLNFVYGTNADEILFSVDKDFALTENIVLHVDGFTRDTGDISVPGFARSAALRSDEPLEEGEAEQFGEIENTDQENSGATIGLSYVGERGFLGFSISRLDNNYGLPTTVGHGHGEEEEGDLEEEEEEIIRIDLEQLRFDVAGDYRFDNGFLKEARLRFGYAEYEQRELEGEETGTLFLNDGFEGRLELAHNPIGNFSGVAGVQIRSRDFSAIGEEAFVAPNTQTQYGVFLVERGDYGLLSVEGGLRLELQENSLESGLLDRDFVNLSASAGYSYQLQQGLNLVGSVFYTERAPNPEELFSNGPHLATQVFEVGDPNLDVETSIGLEGGLNLSSGRVNGSVNVFYTNYNGFIAELFTGEIEDDLPVAVFQNQDAEFFGFEISTVIEAWRDGDNGIDIDFGVDYVEAHLTELRADVPRIPPLSFLGGITYVSNLFDFRLEGEWNAAQEQIFVDDLSLPENVEIFEFPTDDFFLLNASIRLHPFESPDISLAFEVRNLLDQEVRYATSSIRDFIPAAGIDFRFGVSMAF